MFNKKQIEEIREHLERAQNPVFLYDNDADGLCSFILLRKFINRGKGVAIRSYPDLNEQYAKRAIELNADYVFVLDKPLISKEFVEALDKVQIPVVWIDHHDVSDEGYERDFTNFYLYNVAKNKGKEKSDEPVSYWAYKIAGRKEDLWISMMGCISDHYLPDFSNEFAENYGEYWGKVKEPFDAYYKTEIGRIARSLNFGIKDSMSNVVNLQNFLIKCKGPSEVFSEVIHNESFRKRYEEIKKRYDSLLEKAKESVEEDLVFFEYGGEMSISSDLANELYYTHKGKYVAVAYTKGAIANVSLRGKGVKKILDRILKQMENASGGGHEDAVGARIKAEDLGRFKELLKKEM